ncbi:MAG TPA: (2Fe-2S) ferredoxin domain-containing protein [Sphingomonas sp.]|nr:(2Fe-2S) ferredoxin domain-containing protein [Sphingomonas sp.]
MKAVRSDWESAILVCGKCSKKLGGGFGKKGKTRLGKAVRQLLGVRTGRRASIGIVETRCLGVCPRNAVVVVDSRQPDSWMVVPKGDDLLALVDRLRVG